MLTAAKVVANTALRWVGPFLPTLEHAFGVSTSTLTSVMGVGELGGLTTIATGHALDRGHRRRTFLAGLSLVGIASLIALIGSVVSFAVAFSLVVIGVGNLTVAGHAWISDRVPYRGRGRALGTFETAWALSLLLGATGIAALIKAFGWRGPFVALAIVTAAAFVAVIAFVSPDRTTSRAERRRAGPIPRSGWMTLALLGTDRRFEHLRLRRVGDMARRPPWRVDRGPRLRGDRLRRRRIGGEHVVAAVADRIGLRRSVLIGLGVLGLGLAIVAGSGQVEDARHHGADRVPRRVRVRVRRVVVVGDRGGSRWRDGRAIGAGNALGTHRQVGGGPREWAALRRCRHRWLARVVSVAAAIAAGLIVSGVSHTSGAGSPTRDASSTIAAATASACVFGPKWRAAATSTTRQSGSSPARYSVPAR